jgi:hypothetical protein
LDDIKSISKYITSDLFNYLTDFYKHSYFIWDRTGGYNSSVVDASEIKVSAEEINSLSGISTAVTVQVQLDSKASISSLGSMAYQNFNSVSITGGSLQNVFISNSDIEQTNILIKQGSSGEQMEAGGVSIVDTTATGNIGAGEDDLITYTLPLDSLDRDGAFIEIEVFGTFASNANNKRVRLYFGSTVVYDTTSVAANSGSWIIKSRVIRTSSSSQKAITEIISNNILIVNGSSYTTPSEVLTGNVNIRCTGEAVANDDVVQEGLIVKLFNG